MSELTVAARYAKSLIDLAGEQKLVEPIKSDMELFLQTLKTSPELKAVGWTKGLELAKIARRDGQRFDCATWLHKARELPKEDFRREVEKELTGREEEPSELIYFKIYKSQTPVIEQAIETAALMLGSDKSRGFRSPPANR